VILAKFRLFPPVEQRSQVLETLRSVQGPTQVKPSCLAVQVYQEEGPDAAILYLEEWDSEPEFCEHVKSELYRRVLAAIDVSKAAPELGFYRVSDVEGLELLQRIRGSCGGIGSAAKTRSQSSRMPIAPGAR
jgi:quinol monooxygenase YgiN